MAEQLSEDFYVHDESDEWLTRVVVDTSKRKFYLYSNEGTTKEVDCKNVDQFMDVLEVVRKLIDEKYIGYSNPI